MSFHNRLLPTRAILRCHQQTSALHGSSTSRRFWDLLNLEALTAKKEHGKVASSPKTYSPKKLDNHVESYAFLREDVVLPVKSFFVKSAVKINRIPKSSKSLQNPHGAVCLEQQKPSTSPVVVCNQKPSCEKALTVSRGIEQPKSLVAVTKEAVDSSSPASGSSEEKAACFAKSKSYGGVDASPYYTQKSHFSTTASQALGLYGHAPAGIEDPCFNSGKKGGKKPESKKSDKVAVGKKCSLDPSEHKNGDCGCGKKPLPTSVCGSKTKFSSDLVLPLIRTGTYSPLYTSVRFVNTSSGQRSGNKDECRPDCPNTAKPKTRKELEREREDIVKREHKEIEECLAARFKKQPADNKKK